MSTSSSSPRRPSVESAPPSRGLPATFLVGRYRVVDELGVGGMARVHLARIDGPGGFQKWVAIKRIHAHLVEDSQFVDMFLDEARIAAGINHVNVAQVFDLGRDDDTYWIAMEYLHGEPLREVMRRAADLGARVPYGVAARIAADAAEGLHGAHELRGRQGQLLDLVHRDVSPHNLFVTYDGYTKVVDFGIAKVVDRLASTRVGTLKGKLAYMSPEQVSGAAVDRRSDIFALGVVLWELMTGRRLFRMESELDTLEKVQACVVPPPSSIAPDCPASLEQVVLRALAARPEDRFQTAREFSRALQAALLVQGVMVPSEDVGNFLHALFADRIAKRDRYLEWAAEATSGAEETRVAETPAPPTVVLPRPSLPPEDVVRRSRSVPPAPATLPMAAGEPLGSDDGDPLAALTAETTVPRARAFAVDDLAATIVRPAPAAAPPADPPRLAAGRRRAVAIVMASALVTLSVVVLVARGLAPAERGDREGSVAPPRRAGSSPSPEAPHDGAFGMLSVECSPSCDAIVVAGRSLGPSPVSSARVPVGAHRLTVSRGGAEQTLAVDIRANETTIRSVGP